MQMLLYLTFVHDLIILFKDILQSAGFYALLLNITQRRGGRQPSPLRREIADKTLTMNGISQEGLDHHDRRTDGIDGRSERHQEQIYPQSTAHADGETVCRESRHLARTTQTVLHLSLHVGVEEVEEIKAVVLRQIWHK